MIWHTKNLPNTDERTRSNQFPFCPLVALTRPRARRSRRPMLRSMDWLEKIIVLRHDCCESPALAKGQWVAWEEHCDGCERPARARYCIGAYGADVLGAGLTWSSIVDSEKIEWPSGFPHWFASTHWPHPDGRGPTSQTVTKLAIGVEKVRQTVVHFQQGSQQGLKWRRLDRGQGHGGDRTRSTCSMKGKNWHSHLPSESYTCNWSQNGWDWRLEGESTRKLEKLFHWLMFENWWHREHAVWKSEWTCTDSCPMCVAVSLDYGLEI